MPTVNTSRVRELRPRSAAQVMAVSSGKGGVGKTTVAINIAIAQSSLGKRVLLLDADMGLANVDVMLGLKPAFNLSHVFAGKCDLAQAIVTGPGDIDIVPGASGIAHMADLGSSERTGLIHAFGALAKDYEVLVVDTPAGIGGGVLDFCLASQEVLVVLCDEPASMADAYALIKLVSQQQAGRRFRIIVNRARSPAAGRALFKRLQEVVAGFINARLELAAIIPEDTSVTSANRQRKALLLRTPGAPAALEFKNLAVQADTWPVPRHASGGIEFFIEHLVRPAMEEARA